MLSLPPSNPQALTASQTLADWLEPLIGTPFKLTGKSRTDGSNARKLVTACLEKHYSDKPVYNSQPKCAKKGLPRIVRELIDTYIVTTGSNYNLQVWNRVPSSDNVLIDYGEEGSLTCSDVRFVFVRINPEKSYIESIIVASPKEIEHRFGQFGVPTIKWQLIISDAKRQEIVNSKPPLLTESDLLPKEMLCKEISYHSINMDDKPESGKLTSIESMASILVNSLLGLEIEPAATKNRGQQLEYNVISLLGYDINSDSSLAGGYPDLPNQALEVKIQDSPTVDLGKYSPQFKMDIFPELSINTENTRYLIALMNTESNTIEGMILLPGKTLGEHFTYVTDKSYKCQRSIPMSFFDSYRNQCVFIG